MRSSILAIATVAALVAGRAQAQTVELKLDQGSKIWLDGKSTVHPFTCASTEATASVAVDASFGKAGTAPTRALKTTEVTIPVKTLKCGHEKMNDNMYKAMKADANSTIKFELTGYEPLKAVTADSMILRTNGKLTIAGVEKPITVDVNVARGADLKARGTGQVAVRMSEFGIKPPVMMLGALRVTDEVLVGFDLKLSRQAVVALISK